MDGRMWSKKRRSPPKNLKKNLKKKPLKITDENVMDKMLEDEMHGERCSPGGKTVDDKNAKIEKIIPRTMELHLYVCAPLRARTANGARSARGRQRS